MYYLKCLGLTKFMRQTENQESMTYTQGKKQSIATFFPRKREKSLCSPYCLHSFDCKPILSRREKEKPLLWNASKHWASGEDVLLPYEWELMASGLKPFNIQGLHFNPGFSFLCLESSNYSRKRKIFFSTTPPSSG